MNIHFGVDYSLEHWPEERWETDAQLMREMGVQAVRMAGFSCPGSAPPEDGFEFERLEAAVALFERHGIKTILAMPGAEPPAWQIGKNPGMQPADRQEYHHGCLSDTVFHTCIRHFVTAFSRKFADNPGVIGWQIGSASGNGYAVPYLCDSCKTHFQKWLADKYGTIGALNNAWGIASWNRVYHDFPQITIPSITSAGENPSAMLDWKCFCSSRIVDFAKWQADIIRENCPGQFITHSHMRFGSQADCYDLGELLDFASNDAYPAGHWHTVPCQPGSRLAAAHDVVRGFKKRTFWMMGLQPGMTGGKIMGRAPEPGQMSVWAMQSVAHGADAVVFSRWRTYAAGAEQYWHGILGHSGRPGRIYNEAKHLAHTFAPYMEELEGAMPEAQAAIVYSFRQDYAFGLHPHHPDLRYAEHLCKYHKALYDRKIPVDFVRETEDISKYRLVAAPLQYLMTPELEQRYIDYVADGGHLILTMRTGVKDAANLCMTDRELPGRLGDICGMEVPEYDCLPDAAGSVLYGKKEYKIEKWCDIITLKGARQIAEYSTGFYKQTPAITENTYGGGTVWYVGTEPGEELMEDLMSYIADVSGIRTLGAAADSVEIMTRATEDKVWLFVINHTGDEQVYHLHDRYTLLEGGKEAFLKPYEVQLFVRNKRSGSR